MCKLRHLKGPSSVQVLSLGGVQTEGDIPSSTSFEPKDDFESTDECETVLCINFWYVFLNLCSGNNWYLSHI